MSQTQKIYSEYLSKWNDAHQNVVQPVVHQYADARKVAAEARSGKLRTTCCKFWNSMGEVFELADGRVVEVVHTTSGMSQVTATFPTLDSWLKFDKPMTFNQYFERW